ncbi:MAG: DNA/RNA non-specific endonuclease [Clostridia bacterium]|nr:DNA/RNA non-specific endonuclease [Clostridia bacterium]
MGKTGSAITKFILAIVFLIIAGLGISGDFKTEIDTVITQNQETNDTLTEKEETSNSQEENPSEDSNVDQSLERSFSLESLPEYKDEPYVIINDNIPFFDEDDMTTKSYEMFSELDELGRCGVVHASIGKDLMPTEEREYIGYVKPTGWQASRYEGVDGGYLYNRCHLIGFQLTGENANEKNLITGTRFMNVQGMLPFENQVANYVKNTENHVMYRVTPIFEEENLVASGVLMEAKSVEDNGDGVMFNVYCYNVQPNIVIDYSTGANYKVETSEEDNTGERMEYILNTNSKKFHLPSCDGVNQMSEKNKKNYTGYKSELISQGYEACGSCNP